MDDDDDEDEVEVVKSFTGAHKLVMFCSPLFNGAVHIVFMTLNHEASTMDNDLVKPGAIAKFLITEQLASFGAMLFAMVADSYAARYNLMKFAVLFTSVPMIFFTISDQHFERFISGPHREGLFLCGIATMSVYIVLMPVEKAFTAELIPGNSPLLRKYVFTIYYMSYVWQGIFGVLINLPNYFDKDTDKEGLTFGAFVLQIILWVAMIIAYIIVLFFRRVEPRNVNFAIAANATICIYRVIWVNFENLVHFLRDSNYEMKDGYETCSDLYTSEVVHSSKKIFKLFILQFCLMFFHGLELILRTMWYQQDSSMYRSSIFYGFPLDVVLLISIVIWFPIVEYFIYPLFRKFSRIQLSDLKVVGIATVLMAIAYMLTMVITMMLLQETTNNPGRDRIAVRMYNTHLYPIEWSVESNGTKRTLLHIPSIKSRAYINTWEGVYSWKVRTPYTSMKAEKKMKKGDLFNLIAYGNHVVPLTEVDKELHNLPLIGAPDVHIFVLPVLSRYTKVRLDTFMMDFVGKDNRHTFRDFQKRNMTHLVVWRDSYTIKITSNVNNLTRTLDLWDFSLFTVIVYDSFEGKMNLRFENLRSGSSHNRMLALPQVIIASLAICFGKVPLHIYTYQHAPSSLLSTAFSFYRFGFAASIITFNLVTTQMTLTSLGVIGFLVFFFVLAFYYVTLQRDLNFDEEDELRQKKVEVKVETRAEED